MSDASCPSWLAQATRRVTSSGGPSTRSAIRQYQRPKTLEDPPFYGIPLCRTIPPFRTHGDRPSPTKIEKNFAGTAYSHGLFQHFLWSESIGCSDRSSRLLGCLDVRAVSRGGPWLCQVSPGSAPTRRARRRRPGARRHACLRRAASPVAHVHVDRVVETVQHDDDTERPATNVPRLRRTALMVPNPASATNTTSRGRGGTQREAIAVSGQRRRTPPADSTSPRPRPSVGPRQLGDQSLIVNAGRPSAAAARVAPGRPRTSARRGHTVSGASPVAAPSRRHRAHRDRRRGRRTGPACGRRRSHLAAEKGEELRGHPRLAHLGPRADDHHQPARARTVTARSSMCGESEGAGNGAAVEREGRERDQRSEQASHVLVGVGGRQVTRSRLVPTGTVGGRMAGTHRPPPSSCGGRVERRLSEPRTIGMIGLGWPGGARPASASRSIREASRASRASPSAERRTQRGEGGGGVGRCRRGREDVGPRPVDEEIDDVAGRGHEAAQGSRGSWRGSRRARSAASARRGRGRDRGRRAPRRGRGARRGGRTARRVRRAAPCPHPWRRPSR